MLKTLFLKISPIVFAVLLALALDAWYDIQKTEQRVQVALQEITLDIRTYFDLEGVYKINATNLQTLKKQLAQYEKNGDESFTVAFARPEINAIAWDMAKETGLASHFGRELYKDLAVVFIEFDRLQKIWEYNYQFQLERDPNMGQYTLARHYVRQLETIQLRHRELMDKSGKFLEKYKYEDFM